MDDIFGLDGKTAIVAGGAGVIGTVMSAALLNAGANVVIWSRTQKSIDQALQKLSPSNKFVETDELVGATLFLASNMASGFVTGVSIPADGGYLAFNI